MLNVICLVGRLTADPELRTTTTGISTCRFSIAVDREFVKQGEERQADFFDVVAWRQQAEFVTKYFHKGSWVSVVGSMQSRTYDDKNGIKRKVFEVMASSISFCGNKSDSSQGGSFQRRPDEGQDTQKASFSNASGADFGADSGSDTDLPF